MRILALGIFESPLFMRFLRQKWPEHRASTCIYCSNCGSSVKCGARGFTLLEILIVVVIIGITLTFAVANLAPDENELLQQETDRTLVMLESARDEAAFSGRGVAVNITGNTLTFFVRDAKSSDVKWLPLRDGQLSARPFAGGISGRIQLDGREPNSHQTEMALFQPAGVGLPFTLQLISNAGQRIIAADALGNLSLASDHDGVNANRNAR